GIDDADQERIFGEFQQVENAKTRKPGGTGLGLAIAKRMVEMQGGLISVDSVLGRGSTFRVVLPVHVEPALDEAAECPGASDGARYAESRRTVAGGRVHRAASEAVLAAVQDAAAGADLATKADLGALRVELGAEIADLRGELRQSELRLEAKFEAIKAD